MHLIPRFITCTNTSVYSTFNHRITYLVCNTCTSADRILANEEEESRKALKVAVRSNTSRSRSCNQSIMTAYRKRLHGVRLQKQTGLCNIDCEREKGAVTQPKHSVCFPGEIKIGSKNLFHHAYHNNDSLLQRHSCLPFARILTEKEPRSAHTKCCRNCTNKLLGRHYDTDAVRWTERKRGTRMGRSP